MLKHEEPGESASRFTRRECAPRPVFPSTLVVAIVLVIGAGRALGQPVLIGADAVSDQLIQIDPATGNSTPIGPLGDPIVASLEFDFNHGILYGSSTATDSLLRIDASNGATTVVGSFGGPQLMHAIGYDSNNDILYGASGSPGQLFTIDVNTGAAVAIGFLGFQRAAGGMAFDPVNDVMYATDAGGRTTGLFTVDLNTGAATRVGLHNNPSVVQLMGLAFHPVLGMFASDNKLIGIPNDQLFSIDPASGQATLVGDLNASNTLGLTFVPEPASLLLLLLGLGVLALRRCR